MPNIKSAMKRMRSDAKKQARNQATLAELKTLEKQLRGLSAKPSEAKTYLKKTLSRFDRAVSRGIVPRGRADRKKARLTAFVSKLK